MKKTKYLAVLLRFCAGLSVLFAFYGVWCLLLDALMKQPGREWVSTLLSVGAGTLAMCLRWGLSNTKMPPWGLDVLTAVLTVFFAVGGGFFWVLVLGYGIEGGIAAGVANVGAVLIGDLCGRRQPGMYAIMGVGAVLLVSAGIVKVSMPDASPSMDGFVWIFFLSSGFITACSNYSGIDRHMSRRGHSKSRLPGKVRRNNLLLLGGLFGVGALILLVREPLAELLKNIVKGIVLLFYIVTNFLFSLKPRSAGGGGEDLSDKEFSGFADENAAGNSDTVFWVLLGIGIVLAVVYGTKPLLRWIREKLEKLRTAVMRWLRRRSAADDRAETAGDYVDVTEEISDSRSPETQKRQSTGIRSWKREVQRFSRMPAGRERFAEGYRLILRGSALRGVKHAPSDTPLETAGKVSPLVAGADMQAVCRQAEEIVFSGRMADTDTAGVEKTLEILKKKS